MISERQLLDTLQQLARAEERVAERDREIDRLRAELAAVEGDLTEALVMAVAA